MASSRPILITVIAVLYLLVAVMFIGLGALSLIAAAGGATDPDMSFNAAGGALIVLSLIYLVIAIGFFKGWKLWWYLGIIFAIIGIVLGILSFPAGILGLIIDLIILWYLFRPNVKSFFLD